jgi:hypothetical protein
MRWKEQVDLGAHFSSFGIQSADLLTGKATFVLSILSSFEGEGIAPVFRGLSHTSHCPLWLLFVWQIATKVCVCRDLFPFPRVLAT